MESTRDDISEKNDKPTEISYTAQLGELLSSSTSKPKQVTPPYVPFEDDDPINAAKRTGPRVYELINYTSPDIRFATFGCQGDKHLTSQRKAATHFKETIHNHPTLKPAFGAGLGDNFYDNGVDSPFDNRFNTQFYDMYSPPFADYKLPFFMVAGNHDHNMEKKDKARKKVGLSSLAVGRERAIQQVAHSYLVHEGDPKLTINKAEFYRQSTLDYEKLPRWNMPWFYYSIIIGNLQLFFLDSNTIAEEYFDWWEKEQEREKNKNLGRLSPHDNQIAWLIEEFQKCQSAGRTPALFQHHPLVTCGKRGRYGGGDANLYFKDTAHWEKLATLFSLDVNDYQYNSLILNIYKKLNIKFSANFAAHDHGIYNYVSDDIRQFVVGSGGGELHNRECFDKHNNIGFYLKEMGFMSFFCNKKNPKIMSLKVFTEPGHELELTNASSLPITKFQDRDSAELYKIVLEACKLHAKALADIQSTADEESKRRLQGYNYYFAASMNYWNKPKLEDVDGMHAIMAYFCQPTLGNFQPVLTRLKALMSGLSLKTTDHSSLYGKINQLLKESRFGKTVAELSDVNVVEPLSTSTTSPSQ